MFGHFILSVIIARESTRNSTEPIQTAKPRCLQNSPLQSVYLFSKQRVSDNRFLCNQGNVEHLSSNNHHTHCHALYPSEYEEAVPSAANFNNYMQASSKKVDLALKGLKPGTVFEIEILDKEHGKKVSLPLGNLSFQNHHEKSPRRRLSLQIHP